jgi:hypothetical protein
MHEQECIFPLDIANVVVSRSPSDDQGTTLRRAIAESLTCHAAIDTR